MDSKLETPAQLAKRVGISEKAVRKLLRDGKLSFVRIGTRLRIPPGTWEVYLETQTVRPWRDVALDHDSDFSRSAACTTLFGPKVDARASAALVQQTAQRLKSSSQFLQRHTQKATAREPAEILVTEVLSYYLQHLEVSQRDGERAAYASVPLAEFFNGRTLAEVPALCENFGIWRKVSAGTVRRDLGVLQSAIKHAAQSQIITRSVIVVRPKEPPPRERWLTRSEAATLIAAALGFQPITYDMSSRTPLMWRRVARPQYHLCLFILVGLYTGRRKEAILSLRWTKVDLVRGKIDFRRERTTETKKKRGLCAIPPRLLPHLVRAKGHGHNIGHVILWGGEAIEDVKTAFNKASKRAYLENVTPHTLKHTAATWLMQSGTDPFKISDFLATSVPTLLKHYGHHNPDHQNEVAAAIGARPKSKNGAQS